MDNKDLEYFYIPLETLKLLYSNGVNHLELRNSIEETCKKLNNKQIYWDMTNTKYYVSKHLDSKKLDTSEAESLVDITILYLPRLNKTNKKDGYVNSIVCIICKVNKFMKLRYELKHIGNTFPTETLHSKYLDYIIMEKIIYQLNLKSKKRKGKLKTLETQKLPDKAKDEITAALNNTFKKTLVDLTMELYYYDKDIQSSDIYFFKICNEPNFKRRFIEIINSIARVALMLYSSNYNYKLTLYCRNKYINVLTRSKDGKSVEIIDGEKIYEQIESICNKQLSKGKVNRFFRAGEIGI